MDDMVFHNNNKNAIYVLNSNYNSYGELGRSNIFGSSKFNDMLPTSMDCQPLRKSSLTQKPNPAKYSTENFSSSCSPATSAIQKLFNCSSINNSGSGHNNSYINNNNNNYNNNNNLNNNNNNNNSNRNNHKNSNSTSHLNELGQPKLTTLGSSSKSYHNHHSNGTTTNHIGGVTICASSGIGAMKKGPPIKSTLIAKKTKFWKCLEEEKWRKLSIEHLSTTNCERNSCNTSTSPNTSSMISIQPTISNSENKNKQQQPFDELSSNNEHNSIPIANTYNWSRNDDNNKNQKSTSELYKEAAQLLGLSCTLCDNCRCLDCQSRYFECDDSDSFSEISFMDDYYDEMATMSECHDFQSMEYNGDVNNDIIIEPHQFINEGAIGHDDQNQMPSGSADANDDTHINDVDDDYDETYEDGDDYNNTEYGDSPERQQQHERCDIEQHYNCQSLKFNGQHNITNGPIEVNNCKIANDVCSENLKLVLATEK